MALRLELSSPVAFEPVSKVTQVFFQQATQQVFSVRSGGATGILVKGFVDANCHTFRLADAGQVVTIKLSPDQKVLAVHRVSAANEISFVNVERAGTNGVLDETRPYTQAAKNKAANVLGFSWTGVTEVAFFTSSGVELHSVVPDRRLVRNVRTSANVNISWYVFCPRSHILITAPTASGNVIQPFCLKGSYVYKLPRLELDSNVDIKDKDVAVCTLYDGNVYVAVFVHQKATVDTGSGQASAAPPPRPRSEVHLYSVSKDLSSISKAYVLRLPSSSSAPYALSVVDNLVLVHEQASSVSFVFDVLIPGDFDGTATHVDHVTVAKVAENGATSDSSYASTWVTFQPDVVVDAKEGRMWKLRLRLASADSHAGIEAITDISKLVAFLQRREGAKSLLLDSLLDRLLSSATSLSSVGATFDLINAQYRTHLDAKMQMNLALPASTFSPHNLGVMSPRASTASTTSSTASVVVLDQADLYTSVLTPLSTSGDVSDRRLTAVLVEYYRSLEQHAIPAQHFINEMLIHVLVRSESWFQLQQLLQYHAIADSKPLACLLLSLEAAFPAAAQLALDMLHRLGNAAEEICEVLLSKQRTVAALNYATAAGSGSTPELAQIPPRKFLEAALETNDDSVFFTVYMWFRDRIANIRGYEKYAQIFQQKFPPVES